METEETRLEVGDEQFPARITAPESGSDVGAVLLPGANSGAFGGIFDELARAVADSGATFLQFETWDGMAELGEKELADLHAELDAAADLLRERGGTASSPSARVSGATSPSPTTPPDLQEWCCGHPPSARGSTNGGPWPPRNSDSRPSTPSCKSFRRPTTWSRPGTRSGSPTDSTTANSSRYPARATLTSGPAPRDRGVRDGDLRGPVPVVARAADRPR